MNRSDLLNMLKRYSSSIKEEIFFKEQIISFIEKNVDCFERSLEIGHITASCWLLNEDATKALLMHHAKLDRWFQLGGHCDGNSNVLEVALKEAYEESGLTQIFPLSKDIFDIDIHLIPGNQKEKEHFHYDIRFLLQTTGSCELVQNRESKELRWISKDLSLLPTRNRSVIRMFNKWVNQTQN